jgi:glycosyltransferase involved in cell wall biosynthesis
LIALLGARDNPVDGVEDYCNCLREEFAQCGRTMQVARIPWVEKGWLQGLLWLWNEARAWRGRWVFLQYTALQWSRRGFSVPALAVMTILKLRRARCAVVFHDGAPYGGRQFLQRARTAVQTQVMRSLCHRAELVITTISPSASTWIPRTSAKIVCIPVGANLPVQPLHSKLTESQACGVKTVAIFSVSGGSVGLVELGYVARTVAGAADRMESRLRLTVLGRNSEDALGPLRQVLDKHSVETVASGLLPAGEIGQALAGADVLLFVRGGISSRRGSAIAGIVCGVPVVAFSNRETAPPVTEAGVLLAPEGDCQALSDALLRVLTDDTLRVELRQKNLRARELYFSWNAIVRAYRHAITDA